MAQSKVVETFDARGLLCPLPLVLTLRRLRSFRGRLLVLADDPAAPEDFRTASQEDHLTLIAVVKNGDHWVLEVETVTR